MLFFFVFVLWGCPGVDCAPRGAEVPGEPVRHPDHRVFRVRRLLRVRSGNDHLPQRLLAPLVSDAVFLGPARERADYAPVLLARTLASDRRVLQVLLLLLCK